MSQTLTKPILLDETGQAIKTALQNIDETESQDWLLSYEDVHSELDDNIASIAGSLSDIRDILEMQGRKAVGITVVTPPTKSQQYIGAHLDLSGLSVCAKMSNGINSILVDVTEACTFSPDKGSTIPDNIEELTVTISYVTETQTLTTTTTIQIDDSLKIVTWGGGTDAEVAAMLDAYYNDDIDIYEYWRVGDERQIPLSAMSATGVDDSHIAQTVTMVLLNKGGKTLTTPINNHTECAFVVGQKSPLTNNVCVSYSNEENGEMMHQSSSREELTDEYNWYNCLRRTWCNNTYKNAIPSSIRGIFKSHKNISANSAFNHFTKQFISLNDSVTDDYFTLPAMEEVFGTITEEYGQAMIYKDYGATDYPYPEEDENIQFDYYKDSIGRQKKITYTTYNGQQVERTEGAGYWTRSKEKLMQHNTSGNYVRHCCVGVNMAGECTNTYANYTMGIAPQSVI